MVVAVRSTSARHLKARDSMNTLQRHVTHNTGLRVLKFGLGTHEPGPGTHNPDYGS